ncbi:MAG: hypothetical protein IIY33_06350 [Erysipelotrichaceae bacterium]|nr:hypothetical protein [Erysipelotrichaceae bacterium]MBQ1521673.1 hypothetical protein [Erysipelotrichaceae bacterium]
MKLRRLLVLLVLLLVMTGCSKGKIVEKKAPDIIKMFDNKESFVMYAGTSDCENCKEFKDILGQVLNDYRLTVYYFPADDYEDEDVKNLIYNYLYKLQWTPTVYIVENGKVVNINENEDNTLMSIPALTTWLKSNGAIKESSD